jgi:ABC-type nitrate/sulfonate/bicarbonate transport system permease component
VAYLEDSGEGSTPKPGAGLANHNRNTSILNRGNVRLPRLIPWMALVFFLLVWEVASRSNLISVLFFPPPSMIGSSLLKQIGSGKLAENLSLTLYRLGMGLICGGSIGALIGLILGWSPVLRMITEPFVAATHPLPKIALLPLVLIIFGIGEESKIVLISLAAFFPMLINAMVGVRQIEGIYWEVAENYGARGLKLMRRVLLPGSMPYMLAGFRLALNAALVVTVAVEQLTARKGLGATIWLAWETLRTEELYATLFVIAVFGLGANWLLGIVSRRLAPWQFE